MTNSIAIGLALVIIAVLGVDMLHYDGTGLIFTGRKLIAAIEFLAVWR